MTGVPFLELQLLTTEQVRLAEYTTLRLGGPASRFTAAGSEADLVEAVAAADRVGEPVLVLGGGSNLVVADDGFPGLVVRVAATGLRLAADDGAVQVTAAAGQDWDELVRGCLAEELSGLECLSGIPGSAGATPIQNVGAYGQEVAETITAVRAYDRLTGQVVRLGRPDLGFGYRTSTFKRQAAAAASAGRPGGGPADGSGGAAPVVATGRFVVLDVTFRLAASPLSAPVRYAELARLLGVAEGSRVPLPEARGAVLELRRRKGMVLDSADPDTRSAGSFFTNPVVSAARFGELSARFGESAGIPHWPAADGGVKLSAAWLIEHAGFARGFRLADDPDGARISTKHTLALTNPDGSTTASLIRLARAIRAGVHAAFGVELAAEPTLVGVSL
ncbi:MAG TPA: UDP-N-acetylmuramate dehydrogenase [Streptosporangiaceae bacterium]|nr:UDP-N-acetylmuramate dehydrogenase [Streptosporangiaceae bacterium]